MKGFSEMHDSIIPKCFVSLLSTILVILPCSVFSMEDPGGGCCGGQDPISKIEYIWVGTEENKPCKGSLCANIPWGSLQLKITYACTSFDLLTFDPTCETFSCGNEQGRLCDTPTSTVSMSFCYHVFYSSCEGKLFFKDSEWELPVREPTQPELITRGPISATASVTTPTDDSIQYNHTPPPSTGFVGYDVRRVGEDACPGTFVLTYLIKTEITPHGLYFHTGGLIPPWAIAKAGSGAVATSGTGSLNYSDGVARESSSTSITIGPFSIAIPGNASDTYNSENPTKIVRTVQEAGSTAGSGITVYSKFSSAEAYAGAVAGTNLKSKGSVEITVYADSVLLEFENPCDEER